MSTDPAELRRLAVCPSLTLGVARQEMLSAADDIERQGKDNEALHAKMTCMCGDSVDHSPWAGHTPISMFDYAVEQEVERRCGRMAAELSKMPTLLNSPGGSVIEVRPLVAEKETKP